MEVAREAAADIIAQDPGECLPQNEVVWSQLKLLKKTMTNFSVIS